MALPRQTGHRHDENQGAGIQFSTCKLSKIIFWSVNTSALEHFVLLFGQHPALTLLSDHPVLQLADTNARRLVASQGDSCGQRCLGARRGSADWLTGEGDIGRGTA